MEWFLSLCGVYFHVIITIIAVSHVSPSHSLSYQFQIHCSWHGQHLLLGHLQICCYLHLPAQQLPALDWLLLAYCNIQHTRILGYRYLLFLLHLQRPVQSDIQSCICNPFLDSATRILYICCHPYPIQCIDSCYWVSIHLLARVGK